MKRPLLALTILGVGLWRSPNLVAADATVAPSPAPEIVGERQRGAFQPRRLDAAQRQAEMDARLEQSLARAQEADRARTIDLMTQFGLGEDDAAAVYEKRLALIEQIRAMEQTGRIPTEDVKRYDVAIRDLLGSGKHTSYRKFEQAKPFWEEAMAIIATVAWPEGADRTKHIPAVGALLQKESLVAGNIEAPYRFVPGSPENVLATEGMDQHAARITGLTKEIENHDGWKELPKEVRVAAAKYFERAAARLKWQNELAKMSPVERRAATRKRMEDRREELRQRILAPEERIVPAPNLPNAF